MHLHKRLRTNCNNIDKKICENRPKYDICSPKLKIARKPLNLFNTASHGSVKYLLTEII